MIIAKSIPQQNGKFLLEFQGPKTLNPVIATSLEDAQRIVDFINRKYIIENLTSWLHQRKYAIAMFNDSHNRNKIVAIDTLEMGLNHRKYASLRNICAFITSSESYFTDIIPSQSSRHYKYFSKTILPILRFATGKDILPD